MKQQQQRLNSSVIFLTIFLLLVVSAESIRLLTNTQDEHMKLSETTSITTIATAGTVEAETLEDKKDHSSDKIQQKMALEGCQKGDRECFKRRMVEEEVHLDYIYTQLHKH